MAKELHLATFKTETRATGEPPLNQRHTRLVWADDEGDAERQIRDQFETETSFGGKTFVWDLDVSRAIGSPDQETE